MSKGRVGTCSATSPGRSFRLAAVANLRYFRDFFESPQVLQHKGSSRLTNTNLHLSGLFPEISVYFPRDYGQRM
ncbi:hypothetical protein E2C01_057717 [Portunus trituberculatus]|uniref:Uncharacterized protein n=1 Tax=Portunus trituberculatus TaxID=210409 RepID=A0A5B7H2S1_PORTR|nr:hypothetical protein [Portunus trituberculatus]